MSTEKIMEQAQVFASAWSVVGGPFDGGDAMEVATQEKDELRRMVAELVEERDALAAKLKDAKHDRDEFRRVMNGFAEKMAELEGQKPVQLDEPDYHWEAMGCGLEDRNITDRYEAMKHGWDCAMDRMFEQISEPLYARPVPAVQSQDAIDAKRYRALRRGQAWSVIDGIGDDLRGEALDAAIDAREALNDQPQAKGD